MDILQDITNPNHPLSIFAIGELKPIPTLSGKEYRECLGSITAGQSLGENLESSFTLDPVAQSILDNSKPGELDLDEAYRILSKHYEEKTSKQMSLELEKKSLDAFSGGVTSDKSATGKSKIKTWVDRLYE